MHAGQAIADELLRDMRNAGTTPLRALFRCECRPPACASHSPNRPVRHTAGEVSARIAIERAAFRIRRVRRNPGELEGLAVVERRVAAAVTDDHRMLG